MSATAALPPSAVRILSKAARQDVASSLIGPGVSPPVAPCAKTLVTPAAPEMASKPDAKRHLTDLAVSLLSPCCNVLMVRITQLLYPQRQAADLRPAATVLLLRDTADGIEVLMTRRSMTASFAPGAFVFPGGGIDAADGQCHAQSSRRAGQSDLRLTQAIAAIRESFEELGVLLARHADGGFFMIFPTLRTLERLQAYTSVDAVLQACASEAPLWTSCPRAGLLAGAEARYMESEAPYGELALVCPDGQIAHALDWQTTEPVKLLKNVLRLTAPNPGVMTGPGTNSYLVGDADTGYIAIDPGPADADHLARLHRAAGGDIRMIVCTHSHPDHSPGAQPLQALCVQAGRAKPAILGLPSAPTARAASAFTPDRVLQNKEHLVLVNAGANAGVNAELKAQTTHTLRVMHTPGHAANHLCLVLLEDGLLFSGDHILNGSTTVVDPPDGNMNAYLDSLDVLNAACDEYAIEFILPAHGYVLGNAKTAIAQLKAHRLKREAKIMAVMQAHPAGTLDDWVPHAYDDVDARIWPVAKRSLLAHVERIQALQAMPEAG